MTKTIQQQINFIKAYVKYKGNMRVNDFLNNGYTMDNFIQYSQSKGINFKKGKQTMLKSACGLLKLAKGKEVRQLKQIIKRLTKTNDDISLENLHNRINLKHSVESLQYVTIACVEKRVTIEPYYYDDDDEFSGIAFYHNCIDGDRYVMIKTTQEFVLDISTYYKEYNIIKGGLF